MYEIEIEDPVVIETKYGDIRTLPDLADTGFKWVVTAPYGKPLYCPFPRFKTAMRAYVFLRYTFKRWLKECKEKGRYAWSF